MQQINDFVSYTSDSNKKELIEIVCNIMKIEYLKETKNLKQNIMKKPPENELLFNFSDILLWLHKINATETSQEMKNVWDTNNKYRTSYFNQSLYNVSYLNYTISLLL